MIKVEQIEVYNFEGAIRGMRNPKNSWEKSDSVFDDIRPDHFSIGKNDLELMQKLYKAGTEHRKYLRQIFVSMDIIAPLYWWKEFDTYKIGTTANSCSTMYKIAAKKFTLDDFSHEHLMVAAKNVLQTTINALNAERNAYVGLGCLALKGDKQCWYSLVQLLPSSYNQRRTVTMNYENAVTIIRQRTGHKLDEWRDFCKTLEQLPYLQEITHGEYGNTLITCKDCKYCKEKFFDDKKTYGKFCDISHIAMKSDDYCSKAVRRV